MRLRGNVLLSPQVSDLLAKKLWASWALSRNVVAKGTEGYGKVVNLYATGQILFHSLFYPTELDRSLIAEAREEDKPVLLQQLSIRSIGVPLRRDVPDRDEFIRMFVYNMTQQPDFGATYFPGAVDMVNKMLARGPVAIWTAGDHDGVPSLGLPGSRDQEWRLRSGGWFDHRRYGSRLFTYAHEDKMALLPSIMDNFESFEVNALVIVEDKVANLLKAQERILRHDPTWQDRITLIWHRQCDATGEAPAKHRTPKLPDGMSESDAIINFELIPTTNGEEVLWAVKYSKFVRILPQRIGWIVDHDDVIANDKLRVAAQQEAVLAWIEQSGWLHSQ